MLHEYNETRGLGDKGNRNSIVTIDQSIPYKQCNGLLHPYFYFKCQPSFLSSTKHQLYQSEKTGSYPMSNFHIWRLTRYNRQTLLAVLARAYIVLPHVA